MHSIARTAEVHPKRILRAGWVLAIMGILGILCAAGCSGPDVSGPPVVDNPNATFKYSTLLDYGSLATVATEVPTCGSMGSVGAKLTFQQQALFLAPDAAAFPVVQHFLVFWDICNEGDHANTVANTYQFNATSSAGGTPSFSRIFTEPLLQPCQCKAAYVEVNNPGRADSYEFHRQETLAPGAYQFGLSVSGINGTQALITP